MYFVVHFVCFWLALFRFCLFHIAFNNNFVMLFCFAVAIVFIIHAHILIKPLSGVERGLILKIRHGLFAMLNNV